MSDGCLLKEGRNKTSYAIRISSNDYQIIKWLHDYLCVGNKIYKHGNNFMIKFRNEESIGFMMRNCLVERKSLILKFPKIPDSCIWDFIRGYFDGNGSVILRKTIYNVYGQVSVTCGSKMFIDNLQVILSKYGIASHIYKDGRINNRSYYLRLTKRSEIEKFYDMLYKDIQDGAMLNRKYDKFVELFNSKLKYKIV